MEKSFKLIMLPMPNFIYYDSPPGTRQEGWTPDANKIPVHTLTQKEAEKYGEMMKEAFIEHWHQKQNFPQRTP